jgi:hypothetical protein
VYNRNGIVVPGDAMAYRLGLNGIANPGDVMHNVSTVQYRKLLCIRETPWHGVSTVQYRKLLCTRETPWHGVSTGITCFPIC